MTLTFRHFPHKHKQMSVLKVERRRVFNITLKINKIMQSYTIKYLVYHTRYDVRWPVVRSSKGTRFESRFCWRFNWLVNSTNILIHILGSLIQDGPQSCAIRTCHNLIIITAHCLINEFDRKVGKFDRKAGRFDRKVVQFDRKVGLFDRKVGQFDQKVGQFLKMKGSVLENEYMEKMSSVRCGKLYPTAYQFLFILFFSVPHKTRRIPKRQWRDSL